MGYGISYLNEMPNSLIEEGERIASLTIRYLEELTDEEEFASLTNEEIINRCIALCEIDESMFLTKEIFYEFLERALKNDIR